MAIRFRKSFKITPGIRVNISKSGVSTSIGKKGLAANLSKKGARMTAGIPGSGLSASKLYPKASGQPVAAPNLGFGGWLIVILIAVTVIGLLLLR
ncbi:DUF4236 domain-containing protein [Pseudomonas aeruginosa]|uniref:DUF4236 domain-containing protein n=1 Tax=Pseudomonas aeruginosa TaxID=287 RepID=UPI0004742DE1|nr:DUF4236 domain-containing protein [Pseudomonas aeruginosa]EIU7179397.1 DUF4236 domain-containing protein [Pseudomonas aeruginosa]EKU2242331.1 DUF4236 domain-containing protein [Pseudomonas aeruginosa]ELS4619298.1 DUF4236 domain-containing protein [Pseudomonas aeruginosa]MBO7947495.1 DUF4236 domain-containing protein [Pseudomonas aeruginosa]MBO8037214.1 DUF4236 domain-containing protein [Pseudomonas aeruginosa]